MVGGLVKALYARGFARSVPDPAAPDAGGTPLEPAVADLFAEQIAYLDHYADGARRAFAAFRGTRVAVLGDGQTARWAALSLIRNGCAAVGVEAALAEGPATARDVDAVRAEAARYTAQGSPAEVAVLPAPGAGTRPDGWAAYEGYDVVIAACGRDAFRTAVALLREGVPQGRTPRWPPGCGAGWPWRRPADPHRAARSRPCSGTCSGTRCSGWSPGRCRPRRGGRCWCRTWRPSTSWRSGCCRIRGVRSAGRRPP